MKYIVHTGKVIIEKPYCGFEYVSLLCLSGSPDQHKRRGTGGRLCTLDVYVDRNVVKTVGKYAHAPVCITQQRETKTRGNATEVARGSLQRPAYIPIY